MFVAFLAKYWNVFDPLLRLSFAAALVARLITTPFGLLISAAILYLGAPAFWGITPLSFGQTLAWLVVLDPMIPLTTLGFLLAYYFAVRAWKQQRQIELHLAAAGEVALFVENFASDSMRLASFVQGAIDLRDLAEQPDPDYAEVLQMATRVLARLHLAHELRQSISARWIELHGMRARNEIVISSSWIFDTSFKAAESGIQQVAEALWFPLLATTSAPTVVVQFFQAADPAPLRKFVDAVNSNQLLLAGAAGAIRGIAYGRLFGPTPSSLTRLLLTARELKKG